MPLRRAGESVGGILVATQLHVVVGLYLVAANFVGANKVLLVSHKVRRTVLQVHAAEVGVYTRRTRIAEVLLHIIYALLVTQPFRLGSHSVACRPEAVEESLLLLEAGALDELARHLLLQLRGYRVEGVEVDIQLLLVGIFAGECSGEVAQLLGFHAGVRAVEGHLLVHQGLVVAVTQLDDEVVVARRQLLDVYTTVHRHQRRAVLAAHHLHVVNAAAGLRALYVSHRQERLATHLLLDVVHLIVEVQLLHLLGVEVADVRLHVVAAAREDGPLPHRRGGVGHRLQAREHGVTAVVVHHHLLCHRRRPRLRSRHIAQRELYTVDTVGQREALHVEEAEVQLVETAHRGAVQLVLLGVEHRVLLTRHESYLHGRLVHARWLLHEAHGPCVHLQVGLHVRAVLRRQVEGRITEQRLHLGLDTRECH